MRRRFALVAAVAATFGLASCGGDDGSTAGGSGAAETSEATSATYAPNGEVAEVSAIDNTFRPEALEVEAGTEVAFSNDGRNDHNVLPSDGSTLWGAPTGSFLPGDTYSYVFTVPGTYSYYCSIHGTAEVGMVGTITVTVTG